MYLNSECPHCGRKIQKISLFVIKPGIITCPACRKMAFVTGTFKGGAAYLAVWFAFCVFIAPIKNTLNDSWIVMLIFGGVLILAVYMMSLFLDLKK